MKKKFHSVFLGVLTLLCACFGFVGCTDNSGTTDKISEGTDGKALVAYFSCTNTTKGVVEKIANLLDSGMVLGKGCGMPYMTARSQYMSKAYELGRSLKLLMSI